MKTRAVFLLISFILTVSLLSQTADARLFSARLMAGDEETFPTGQVGDSPDASVLADKDEELGFESAARLSKVADLYRRRGLYSYAEVIVKDLVEMRQRMVGSDDPEIAGYLNNLADIYRGKRDYAKAEPLYLRSLAMREKSLGLHHPDVGATLGNLADLYREQNRFQEAQPLYERALAILEKVLGLDHPDVAALRARYTSFLAASAQSLVKVREPGIQTLPAAGTGRR